MPNCSEICGHFDVLPKKPLSTGSIFLHRLRHPVLTTPAPADSSSNVEIVTAFDTKPLPPSPDETAPDGSDVRILLKLDAGSMAHFELGPGETSTAVAHRTVEEVWYCLKGRGEMWRRQDGREEVVALEPGICLTLPLATHFQFRTIGDEPLSAVGVTIPPWPNDGEAFTVPGKWHPTVP